jgi:CRP-like cAMP-binding protein
MADIKEIRNQVLRSLDIDDFRLLQSRLTRIEFKLGDPFETAGVPIERVYFPESGLASIVVRLAPGDDIEVGVAGWENMTGAALVLGDSQSPFECMAQMPGEAFSIAAADFLEALDQSQTLSRHMVKFARALSIQTAFTAYVNGHETIVSRLARWLLMLHDRVDGDALSITHNFLSTMMGVRRQSVTEALHILEGKHLLVSGRASIVLRDRRGMIALAGAAYGDAEREYTRLTGQPLSK